MYVHNDHHPEIPIRYKMDHQPQFFRRFIETFAPGGRDSQSSCQGGANSDAYWTQKYRRGRGLKYIYLITTGFDISPSLIDDFRFGIEEETFDIEFSDQRVVGFERF